MAAPHSPASPSAALGQIGLIASARRAVSAGRALLGRPVVAATVSLAVLVVVVVAFQFALAGASIGVRLIAVLAGALGLRGFLAAVVRAVRGPATPVGPYLAGIWLVVLIGAAAIVPLLPLSESINPSNTLGTRSFVRPDLFSRNPLGTDSQGLDVLGGLLHGARVSLTVGLGATLAGAVLGGAIGMIAGYRRGWFEHAVELVTNTILAFPALVFLLAMVTVLSPSLRNVTIALAVLAVPLYARIARANTLAVAEREYVLAARALGESNRRILVAEILPNVALPLASYGFVVIANLIVAEASLSFLGLGVQRPDPTWGNMIAAGQRNFREVPHVVLAPGVALFLTVYAISTLGDYLRRRWDARDIRL